MAPKTAAEKMRDYRKRMSEEKKAEVRKKNREQQKKCRKQWKDQRRALERKNAKERMRKMRERKALKQDIRPVQSPLQAFGSVQALGKAVHRVNRSLPKSPRRKRAVVQNLAEKFGCFSAKDSANPTPRATALDSEIATKVISFYESDTISRQLPGRKDFVTEKDHESGKKRMTQKKILIMTVMEAYKLFKQENVGIKLGKSKFAALRPQHVRPVSDKDLNVCCCRYHENADLLIGGFRKVWKKLPPDLDRLVSAVTCSEDISCYFGECDNCKDINNAIERYKDCETDNLDDTCVCYYQWNSTNHKELIQTTLFEAKEELLSQLPNLLRHCFTANIQLREIRHLKQTCCKNEAVLQEDFAENFAIRQQNEIMSAHWISEGVTIFTAIISRNGTTIPYAVISNELRHDKCSVFSFNKALLDHAGSDGDVISVLHVFSDGAGGQFKNRYTLSQCVLTPQELHKDLIYLDWSFFATAHGKGPIDGIGGTVKRAVWRRVLQGNVVISSAKEFYECAKHACPNINVLFLSSDDMSCDRTILSEKWNAAQPKPIPNLHKIHYVRASNPQVVAVSAISPFMDNISVSFTEVAMFDQPDSAMMEKNLHCKKKNLNCKHDTRV